MIQEQHVTYNTARLLKEAGFPQEPGPIVYKADYSENGKGRTGEVYSTPTQAQTMRWLREKKAIFIDLHPNTLADYALKSFNWGVALIKDGMCFTFDYGSSTTYEAAAEAGIQAACKYIIKKGGKE